MDSQQSRSFEPSRTCYFCGDTDSVEDRENPEYSSYINVRVDPLICDCGSRLVPCSYQPQDECDTCHKSFKVSEELPSHIDCCEPCYQKMTAEETHKCSGEMDYELGYRICDYKDDPRCPQHDEEECLGCGGPNKPGAGGYCSSCWQQRYGYDDEEADE